MAKKKNKKVKTKTQKAAAKIGKQVEQNTSEMAYKIWLAGVGAYGKAYDVSMQGAKVAGGQSTEVFDDLVKRGEEIESDVRARLAGDERVLKAGQQVSKAFGAAREMQSEARERFEARMERMRDLLGVKDLGTTRDKLAKQLDKLEDQVVELTGMAKKSKKSKKGDATLRDRLARLTAEIEAVATEAGADIAKTAKKAASKTSKAVTEAVAPVEAKTKAKTATKPATKKAKPATKKTAAKAKAPAKAAVKAPARAKPVAKRAAPKTASAAKSMDDLTQITGVGPALARRLNAEGIKSYGDIAKMTKTQAAALDDKITARGRIVRDDWIKQAKALMK